MYFAIINDHYYPSSNFAACDLTCTFYCSLSVFLNPISFGVLISLVPAPHPLGGGGGGGGAFIHVNIE